MQTKHTPGPWAFHQDSRNIVSTPDNQGRYMTIGQLSESLFITDPEHVANARLIAAAPELLTTLRSAEAALRYAAQEAKGKVRAEIVGGWLYHADQCLAALAKATGGQP